MEIKKLTGSKSKNQKGIKRAIKFRMTPLVLFLVLLFSSQATFAHCDSYDGPVLKEAIEALKKNNVNLILKWISKSQEKEVISLFNKTFLLKDGDKEIYTIVEKHFFETLVRLHRETEDAPFTGLKPAGNISKIIQMSDDSVAEGEINDFVNKFTSHIESVVREKFTKLIKLSKYKNESVEQGRAYVEAYVEYTHMIEGIHAKIERKTSDCAHNH